MTDFFRSRWPLLTILMLFIAFKIPHLHYAYYWDECWPYATAIKEMYRNGISLLPGAIDADSSRGHPLLFHASAALWMKIFGSSHYSMHSFALTISVLMLTLIYEAGLRLFNMRVAIMATALVAVQVMFFVQATSVLPEIMVALFAFASIYYYSRGRYLLTGIALTALFFTKESGLIAGFTIGLDALVSLFRNSESVRLRISRLLSVGVPTGLVLTFFLYQKHLRGWYIYPLHDGLINAHWADFWYSLRLNCMYAVFVLQPRFLFFLPLLALAIAVSIKKRNVRYLAILVPAIIIYYYVDDMRAGRILPPQPFFALFIVSLVALLLSLVKLRILPDRQQQRFIVISVSFTFFYLCFSSLVFITPRYMLAILAPVLFLAAVLYDAFIARTHRALVLPVAALLAIAAIYSFNVSNSFGDTDTGAFDAVQLQQDKVVYFEANNLYGHTIGAVNLAILQLTDPNAGFLHSQRTFKAAWPMDRSVEYALFDNIENDPRYPDIKKDTSYYLVKRLERGKVWAEIYRRKQ